MSDLNKLGVVLGRFQPLTNEHVGLISKALKESEHVLVILGAVDKERDYRNPLTDEERVTALEAEFGEAITIKKLKDSNGREGDWLAGVISLIMNVSKDCDPSEVAIYCGVVDVEQYRERFIYQVKGVSTLSGETTERVRDLMYGGNTATVINLIPESSHDFMLDYMQGNSNRERMAEEAASCIAERSEHDVTAIAHALVAHGDDVLLIRRNSSQGYGQLAIPGGYVEENETSMDAAIASLFYLTGVDLDLLPTQVLSMCTEENLDSLGGRTIGLNYLFVISPEIERSALDLDIDLLTADCRGYEWVSLSDIVEGNTALYYNHNLVCQRLLAHINET